MEIYCQYSGISYKAELFSSKMKIEAVHPIFYASYKSLINRSVDWANGRLNIKERRLLFLSLLNKTELVKFKTTAQPSDVTVQLNMELLLKFMAWRSDIQSSAIRFPEYAINSATYKLENIRQWLNSNFDIIQAWKTNYAKEYLKRSLATKEGALERMIKSTLKPSDRLPGRLAEWAMEASNAPKDLRELWISLFKLKGIQVYEPQYTNDLSELLEHLEDNLTDSLGTIYATQALSHIRKICIANRNGIAFGLGMESSDELQNKLDHPFRIIEESTETHNREVAISMAPMEEPKKENYANIVAFLRAKAAWTLANSAKTREAELVASEKRYEAEAAMMCMNEEEVATDAVENELWAEDFAEKGEARDE